MDKTLLYNACKDEIIHKIIDEDCATYKFSLLSNKKTSCNELWKYPDYFGALLSELTLHEYSYKPIYKDNEFLGFSLTK